MRANRSAGGPERGGVDRDLRQQLEPALQDALRRHGAQPRAGPGGQGLGGNHHHHGRSQQQPQVRPSFQVNFFFMR